MNNRVVTRSIRASRSGGFSTLRFNFRGVGRSQGTFDGGIGELSDAAAALDWLQIDQPQRRGLLGRGRSPSAPGSPCSS